MIGRIIGTLINAGSLLHEGAQAQARWELEVSHTILGQRKKVLLAALVPILFAIGMNFAFADSIPSRIPILGGSKAYMPAFVTPIMFYGSIFVG